jgi:hypothetical protein
VKEGQYGGYILCLGYENGTMKVSLCPLAKHLNSKRQSLPCFSPPGKTAEVAGRGQSQKDPTLTVLEPQVYRQQ